MRIVFSFFVFLTIALSTLQAQVKFDVKLLPDNITYVVSAKAEQTWASPANKVGSVQVVLRHNSDAPFLPAITSLIPGLTWVDNAYVTNAAVPGKTFVCIALVQKATGLINFVEGQSVPLFSFVNTNPNCVGQLDLVSNTDADVATLRNAGFNVTQNMTVLAARGNAVTGFENASANCLLTGVNDPTLIDGLTAFQAFPNPARSLVTVSWNNSLPSTVGEELTLSVFNLLGVEVLTKVVKSTPGASETTFPVEEWASGMYYLRIQTKDKKMSPSCNFLVIK